MEDRSTCESENLLQWNMAFESASVSYLFFPIFLRAKFFGIMILHPGLMPVLNPKHHEMPFQKDNTRKGENPSEE